jgi:hypothetical protein
METALRYLAEGDQLARGWAALADEAAALVSRASPQAEFWHRYLGNRARAARRERASLRRFRDEQVALARDRGVALSRMSPLQAWLRLNRRFGRAYGIAGAVAGVVIAVTLLSWYGVGLASRASIPSPTQPWPCGLLDGNQLAGLVGHDITIEDFPIMPGVEECAYYWQEKDGFADLMFGIDELGTESAGCPKVQHFPLAAVYCDSPGRTGTLYFTLGDYRWYCQENTIVDAASAYRTEESVVFWLAANYRPRTAKPR